jgi:hypothetical protein
MKVKRLLLVVGLVGLVLCSAGCASAWIRSVDSLLPGIVAVINAVFVFAAALLGKTVSQEVFDAIQGWRDSLLDQLANAKEILAAIKNDAQAVLLKQFLAVMEAIREQLQSILQGLAISDSVTLTKITQLVGLAIAAVRAIDALIPVAVTKLEEHASDKELEQYDALAAKGTSEAVRAMREAYSHIRLEQTKNPEVNAALEAMPETL